MNLWFNSKVIGKKIFCTVSGIKQKIEGLNTIYVSAVVYHGP